MSLPWVGSGPRHDIVASHSFSGPRSRPSGPGFRCSGTGAGSGPGTFVFTFAPLHAASPQLHLCTSFPAPEPDTRSPETRDPKMSCPPPATRGCHPPPETLSLSGPPVREPSCPHHRLYSILHTRYSRMPPLHLCTGAPLRFAPLHGIFASLVPSSLPALVTS